MPTPSFTVQNSTKMTQRGDPFLSPQLGTPGVLVTLAAPHLYASSFTSIPYPFKFGGSCLWTQLRGLT